VGCGQVLGVTPANSGANPQEMTYEQLGSCRMQGTLAEFNSDDGSTSLSASAAGAVASVSGSIVIAGGEVPKMYSPMSSGPAGQEPEAAVTDSGFTYSGGMIDFGVGSMTQAAGTLMMTCERLE